MEGNTVVVWIDQIAAPEEVRYAWSGYPDSLANLYNKEGLPVSSFTTEPNP